MKNLICGLTLILFITGCNQKQKEEYIYVAGYVYDALSVHNGGRRFSLLVKYRFEYNQRVYKHSDVFKLGGITSHWVYNVGDSISIKFLKDHPEKSMGCFNHD